MTVHPGHTWHLKTIVILVFAALATLLLYPSQNGEGQQTPPTISPTEVRRAIANAVQKGGKRLGILIDPRITEQIYANVMIYVTNFCPPIKNCIPLFTGDSNLDFMVHKFLADMAELPTGEIMSPAARLAHGDLSSVGWPSQIGVDAGLIEIPPEFRTSPIALRYATKSVALGVGATAILMAPGTANLSIEVAGKSETFSVIVERLRTMRLPPVATSSIEVPSGVLQSGSDAYCWDAKQPPYTGPFALFNYGRASIAESDVSRKNYEAPFVRQSVLSIAVEQDSGIQCGSDCKVALASLFAESVAVWRSGCLRCDPNALVMITTMGSVWLDWRLVRRLNRLAEVATTSLSLEQVETGEREITPSAPIGGKQGISYYVNITDDRIIRQLVCQLNDGVAPWLADVKSYLCPNASKPQTNLLTPKILLKEAATSCEEKAIACGLPFERVEISFSTYRYAIPTNYGRGEIIFGLTNSDQVLDMRHVILHEVGHWFGVPHAQEGGQDQYLDVMGEAYDDGEACVSVHSLRMLANAADLRWSYRIKNGGGALLGPRRGRPMH